jgi:hypothetical protein
VERFLPIAVVLPKSGQREEILTKNPINGISGALPLTRRAAVLGMDDKFL